MRVVLQRVSSASVTIDGRIAGRIERGLLVLLGIETTDTEADGQWLAEKVAKVRIFDDTAGKMNLSLLDLAASAPLASSPSPLALVVSQFTLHASTAKGARPSFNAAARPELARPLYEKFIAQLTTVLGRAPATGEFGAMMQVSLVNDGPVTLIIDSKARD
jgi:D-tyrosyl-tRNA(Tyr) deacylase